MKKLKCSSCGADLKVGDNKEYAVCEHCGSKYKLNEDLNINIQIDDDVKNAITKGAKSFSKLMLIPIVIFIVFFIGIILFGIKSKEKFDNKTQKVESNKEEQEKMIDQFSKESQKYSFNFTFISAPGTKSTFFLKNILDDIIESNKTHDRKITLVFNGQSTIDETEIINIKHGLNEKDNFEVSNNYDDEGYIIEIKVDKID